MALIVEDGTGKSDADAYVSVEYVDQFATDFGDTWPADDEGKDAAIRRATAYLDGLRWSGRKAHGRSQRLQWPRVYVTDTDGWPVASDEVPVELKDACSVLAIVELASPGSLSPQVTPNQIATSETVGPISVSYKASGGVHSARPVVTRAIDGIRPFLKGAFMTLERV